MKYRRSLALAAVLLAAAACSSNQSSNQSANRPSPAPSSLRNPLDFALYPNASVVSTRDFTQKIIVPSGQNSQSIFSSGNGTYAGHEVIAASAASFGDLSSWVNHLSTSPPSGYSAVETGQNPQMQLQTANYGVDYATFQKKEGGHTHGVLVMVMDPQRVNQKFGRILGMIAKYRALPAVMRGPIDNEAKARTGMSLTEATEPESPIGAALAALDEFEHKSTRGIVVIDAAKQ